MAHLASLIDHCIGSDLGPRRNEAQMRFLEGMLVAGHATMHDNLGPDEDEGSGW